MLGSTILDVAIGLIFVFLVVSIIITAVSELIASALKWRASNLEEGIRNLLEPKLSAVREGLMWRIWNWARNLLQSGPSKPDPPPADEAQITKSSDPDIAKELYAHPLVNSLSRPGGKPSYIPSRTFAVSLLDVLAQLNEKAQSEKEAGAVEKAGNAPSAKEKLEGLIASIPNKDLRDSIRVLSEEADHDLEKLKVHIEIWFNNAMDRVSGWYKRRTQLVHVLLGIVFAFALNVDTFLIAKTLANDSALRDSLVAQAQELAKDKPEPGKDSKKEIQERIKQLGGLGLPIGWSDEPVEGLREWPGWLPGTKVKSHADSNITWGALWWQTLRFHIVGWLLTAFATSLGAPFWFDLLNRFMNLRSVGKSPEEKPKAPKKVPQPMGPGETAAEQREKVDEAVKEG
jgi:hypothetical protein